MREYTIIDAHGESFIPHETWPGSEWSHPDEVWISGETGGAWVPWTIARMYDEDVTLEEIAADMAAEGVE